MAASSRDLVDVLALQRRHQGGLSDVVGVAQTQLRDREQSGSGPDLWTQSGRSGWAVGYLSLRVAAPGVDVSGGGQNQRVLGADRHVLNVDPGQRRNLLGPVVVPSSAFWESDQPVLTGCKKTSQH